MTVTSDLTLLSGCSDQSSPLGRSKTHSRSFWSRLCHRQRRKKEKYEYAHTCELLPQQILLNITGIQNSPSLKIFYFSHLT